MYDMLENKAFREDIELETVVGNITSTVIHQGVNFWIVNTLPLGVHQCVCTFIQDDVGNNIYPIQYNWVDNLEYIGREIIGIEYIQEEREVNHYLILFCLINK